MAHVAEALITTPHKSVCSSWVANAHKMLQMPFPRGAHRCAGHVSGRPPAATIPPLRRSGCIGRQQQHAGAWLDRPSCSQATLLPSAAAAGGASCADSQDVPESSLRTADTSSATVEDPNDPLWGPLPGSNGANSTLSAGPAHTSSATSAWSPAAAAAAAASAVAAAAESAPPLAPGLYLVGTPIGNLEDISLRALRVLRGAALVLAEDTRHTAKLLAAYGISNRSVSFHAHNEKGRQERVVQRLLQGEVRGARGLVVAGAAGRAGAEAAVSSNAAAA